MRRPSGLSAWCLERLDAEVGEVLWVKGHLSWVAAVQLGDGRNVVVKARPWTDSLPGCHAVHLHLWRAGFPCPEPLTGPTNVSGVAISAEAHLLGGQPGVGDDPTLAERTACALARMVAAAPQPASIPSLYPPPPWTGWGNASAVPWPAPDEGPELNTHPSTEPLRGLALALNERLLADHAVGRVGHVDFHQGNLRWQESELLAVDDWDSLAVLPEAAIVGCAAASFRPATPGVHPDNWQGAEVADTEEFLERYQQAAGRDFTSAELEVAWAAGLWQRVFDAAKALVAGRPGDAGDQLRDVGTRNQLAGVRRTFA